ncbi:MAG: cupin domain-containing protein [Chloroflexota bacterium]|nr:cupin domain-containing protein [Chloroflexota bacterium]
MTDIVKPGERRTITIGPIRLTVLEDGTSTRGTMAVGEFTFPPQSLSPFPHIHHAHEEGFYVLEGELEFKVDGETIHAGAGSFVMVPIGVPHTFSNPGDHSARFLATFTPPLYIKYFEALSDLMQASVAPGPQQFAALMARYDTEVVS